jgi:hypothetical protein
VPGFLRSVLAILGGYVSMAIVIVLLTAVLKLLLPTWFPTSGAPTGSYLAINIAYSFVAAFAGGYVAVWIAPRAPIQHAIALAAFVLLMSIVSAIGYGNRQPRLYQVVLTVLMPVAVICGGWMRA